MQEPPLLNRKKALVYQTMNRKPYKRFENLLLALIVLTPPLIAIGIAAIAQFLIGPANGLILLGVVIGLMVVVTIVFFMREVRSLRREHEAKIARAVRFAKNLNKGSEK